MVKEAPEVIGEYHINPFEMKVQGLDRTLVDKVFAICDYYLQNRIKSIQGIFTISISCCHLWK